MLNLFPIQFLALFAYFLLRVSVGLVLLFLSYRHFRSRHELSKILVFSWWKHGKFSTWILISVEILIALSLIPGYYTQLGALLLILSSIKLLVLRPYFNHTSLPSRVTYILLLAAGISLFITGAGALAVDLPL